MRPRTPRLVPAELPLLPNKPPVLAPSEPLPKSPPLDPKAVLAPLAALLPKRPPEEAPPVALLDTKHMDKGSQNVFCPSKFLSAWRGGNSVKEGTTTVFDSRGYSSVTLKGPVWTKQYKVHVDIWICMGLAQGCFQKGRRKSLVFQCFQKDQQQRLRRIWIKEVKTCKNGNDFWRPGMTSKAACLHQLWFLAPAVRCISCRSSSTWCVPGPRTLPSSCQSRSSAWRFSIPQFGFASRICSTCLSYNRTGQEALCRGCAAGRSLSCGLCRPQSKDCRRQRSILYRIGFETLQVQTTSSHGW